MLGDTARTGLIVIGAIALLVGAGGIAFNISGFGSAGAPTGVLSRVLVAVVGAAVLAFALINPGKKHFTVTNATIFVKPTAYRGTCPTSVTLIGRVQAKDGPGKVRADLYLSFTGGSHAREATMDDGDSVQQRISVRTSGKGTALFNVLAPTEQSAALPVQFVCAHPRSHR